MDAESQDKRHVLNSLYLKLKDYQSTFLTVEDLKFLGVKAFQVEVSDGQLQFDPCFFRPHPEDVLQKYPIGDPKVIAELDAPPTLDDFLDGVKEFSDEKERLAIARSRHKAHYEESTREGCWDNALQVRAYIHSQIRHGRRRHINDEEPRDWFYLGSLTDLELFNERKGWKKGDPPVSEEVWCKMSWAVKDAYRHWDNGNRAKPITFSQSCRMPMQAMKIKVSLFMS